MTPLDWLRLQVWRWERGYFWFLRSSRKHEYPTIIYCGLPGSGKTLMMVRDCVKLMRRGYVVYSNMAIHDPVTGRRAGGVGSWLDMLRVSVEALEDRAECLESGREPVPGVIFAFDELHLMCDAREWANTPKWWLNLIAQRRHFCVGVIGTTQYPGQVEKRLRTLMDLQISIMRPFRRVPIVSRMPIFCFRELDPVAVEFDPLNAEYKQRYYTWMPWFAYAGYSTNELITSDDWAGYTDAETAQEISVLTERAKRAAARLSDEPQVFMDLFGYEDSDAAA